MFEIPRPSTGDAVAGLSVALILIPQSLAYAVLAGMPPHTGLIVAGVATLAAAPFVSQPLLQTGPTAITSLLTFGSLAALAEPQTPEYVGLAALLALLVGIMRIGVGLSDAGEVAYLLSEPVLVGFTSAAALVIAISQLPDALAVSVDAESILAQGWQAIHDPGQWNLEALAIALVTVLLMVGAKRIHPLIPGVLIAVVASVVLVHLEVLDVPVIGDIPTDLPILDLTLPLGSFGRLLAPALIISLVGFSEASAIARSFAAQRGEPWDPDREFISQGASNVAAGLFGGFPAGGSFSRSAINRHAGAKTAWSGAITGVAVLAALPATGLIEKLPEAVLGGIIIGAVLALMDPRPVLEMRHYSRQQFVIASITFVLTVLLAPEIQWAVLVGIMLAVGAHLRRERYLHVDYWRVDEELHLRPVGVLYFGSAQRLEAQVRKTLRQHEDATHLVVHFDAVGRTDVTGAMAVRNILKEARTRGFTVAVVDLTPTSRKIVSRVLAEDAALDVAPPVEGPFES